MRRQRQHRVLIVLLSTSMTIFVWWYSTILHTTPGMDVIVYSRLDDTGEQLSAVTSDGAQHVQLTHNLRLIAPWLPIPNPFGNHTINQNPVAYPHDDHVWFVSNKDGPNQLYQLSLDGHQEPFAIPIADRDNATVSPDGHMVVFTLGDGTLVVMHTDGSNRHCLSCSLHKTAVAPAWSPNSQHLVFEAWETGGNAIYRVDVDGQHLQRLTPPRSERWATDVVARW